MPQNEIFECLMKVRAYAEKFKRKGLLDAVEEVENVAMEEVLGLTFVQDATGYRNLSGERFGQFAKKRNRSDPVN